MRLNKRSVDAVMPESVDRTYWDDALPMFGMRVRPSGKKTFVVQFRVGGGRKARLRKLTVGVYGSSTVEEARDLAKAILRKAGLGQDPAEERLRHRTAATVAELIDEWSTTGATINRRTGEARSQQNIDNEVAQANHHLKPLIGHRPVVDLTKGDIEHLRNQIAKGDSKTKRKGKKRGVVNVKGGAGTAARTIRLLSSILSFAVDQKLIERNPALGVKLAPSQKRHRYLSAAEMGRLGQVLDAPAPSSTGGKAATIIRLLILTGARRGEIEALKWSEVDFEFGMLRLENSKTGAKIIPLATPVLDLLGAEREWAGEGAKWVFPGARSEGHFDGLSKEWRRMRKEAGIGDVRIHDLRHTFASVGASGGIGLPLIGGILGHRQPSTTQRYAHLADTPLRRAADEIGRQIAARLSAPPEERLTTQSGQRNRRSYDSARSANDGRSIVS